MKKILCFIVMMTAFLSFTDMPASAYSFTVPGTSDLWLAGMPDGSLASGTDHAPYQSPVRITGMDLTGGDLLSFFVSGGVSNGPCCPLAPPDGNGMTSHAAGAENGISNITTPGNSLIGVFLNDSQPNKTSAPAALDFSTLLSRDYLSLAPQLKQAFFIGDGLTGRYERQSIIIPEGSTRLFLGTMDGFEWMNNRGSFTVEVRESGSNSTPEPATLILLGTGIVGLAGMKKKSYNRIVL